MSYWIPLVTAIPNLVLANHQMEVAQRHCDAAVLLLAHFPRRIVPANDRRLLMMGGLSTFESQQVDAEGIRRNPLHVAPEKSVPGCPLQQKAICFETAPGWRRRLDCSTSPSGASDAPKAVLTMFLVRRRSSKRDLYRCRLFRLEYLAAGDEMVCYVSSSEHRIFLVQRVASFVAGQCLSQTVFPHPRAPWYPYPHV